MIYVNKDNVFHLQTEKTSYIFRALPSGQLEAMYYGKRIRKSEGMYGDSGYGYRQRIYERVKR